MMTPGLERAEGQKKWRVSWRKLIRRLGMNRESVKEREREREGGNRKWRTETVNVAKL